MLDNKIITALEKMGFKRWQKTTESGRVMDRLYASPYVLGLETTRYNTGNISSASWRGERISNRWAGELANAKTYIDVESGEIKTTSRYDIVIDSAQEILDKITLEVVENYNEESKEMENAVDEMQRELYFA